MTTKIEAAYLALHQVLTAMAQASDACPDVVARNKSVTDLLSQSRTGAAVYLNLLDETSEVDAELVAGGDDLAEIELTQPAILEVIVFAPTDAERNARFDAVMETFAALLRTLDPNLGGAVDHLRVIRPPSRFVTQGAEGAKAARITIDMTITVPTVFG